MLENDVGTPLKDHNHALVSLRLHTQIIAEHHQPVYYCLKFAILLEDHQAGAFDDLGSDSQFVDILYVQHASRLLTDRPKDYVQELADRLKQLRWHLIHLQHDKELDRLVQQFDAFGDTSRLLFQDYLADSDNLFRKL